MSGHDERERDDTWVRAYAIVPLVAASAAVGLAVIDPTRVALGPLRYVGLLPLAGGIGLVASTAVTVHRAGETLSPVARPGELVTSGPFAYTRNPMYLGVVSAVAGVAAVAGSPAAAGYTAVLWLVYHLIVTRLEEPKLRAAIGAPYEAYCERVPRWLPLGAARR